MTEPCDCKSWLENHNCENGSETTIAHALQAATCQQDIGTMQSLVQQGVDVDSFSPPHGSAIQIAVSRCFNEGVQLLLSQDDIKIQDEPYSKALQTAAGLGYNDIVQSLLTRGVPVDMWARIYPLLHLTSPLCHAIESEQAATVALLLKKGADVNLADSSNETPLQLACRVGGVNIARQLLKKGAEVNAPGSDYRGPALQLACTCNDTGSAELVEMLLDAGADVNQRGGQFECALQAAATKASLSIMDTLLSHGADINNGGGKYGSPLQAAVGDERFYNYPDDHEAAVEFLLSKGADVNQQGGWWGNPFQAVTCRGTVKLMQLLIDHGADVHAQSSEYGNALQAAAATRKIEKVKLLLSYDVDVNAQGGELGTALQGAALSAKSTEIVQLLLDYGAEVNPVPSDRFGTPLRAVSRIRPRERDVRVADLLLEHGADPNDHSDDYPSALESASRPRADTVRRLLLRWGARRPLTEYCNPS